MEKYDISAHPDLRSGHLPASVGDDDIAAGFEELQKRFGFLKRGVAQVTQAAGTSRVNVYNSGGKFPESNKELREKKRSYNKTYQERLRQERRKMEKELLMVGEENEELKRENGSLRSEKDQVDQDLQTRAAENQRLKAEICNLKGKSSHQRLLVDAFSRKLLLANHEDQQLFNLRNENARLRQNVTWNDHMEEKKLFLDRRVDFERRNSHLKIQIQALLKKLYNDKNLEEGQAWQGRGTIF